MPSAPSKPICSGLNFLFHKKQHPIDLGEADVERFLSYLANQCHIAAKTLTTALNSLVF
jgi:hypothetical protein